VQPPFWKTKPIEELSPEEWESLCDGCGRCCLEKLKNSSTGKVYFTAVACPLLDLSTCRCGDYDSRFELVPDCLKLSPDNIYGKWLPPTCAYRLLNEGKDLPDWHPLVSGDPATVEEAGMLVNNFAVSGENIQPEQYEDFILDKDVLKSF
jgi:uncharacterized cysteine cluster protein YcgN (CxxCxxCC family)